MRLRHEISDFTPNSTESSRGLQRTKRRVRWNLWAQENSRFIFISLTEKAFINERLYESTTTCFGNEFIPLMQKYS
jgi:hypothetical protein